MLMRKALDFLERKEVTGSPSNKYQITLNSQSVGAAYLLPNQKALKKYKKEVQETTQKLGLSLTNKKKSKGRLKMVMSQADEL